MNILYVHHGKGVGGAPLSLLYFLNELKSYGNDFKIKVIFIYESDVVKLFKEAHIDCEVLNQRFYRFFYKYYGHSEAGFFKWYQLLAQFYRAISWLLSALYFSKKVLQKEDPDIIHLNSSVLTDWCYAGRKLNAKKIIHVREPLANGYFGIRKYLIRNIYTKYCDHVITISKDNYNRVNLDSKSSIVYNPIDFNKFNKNIKPNITVNENIKVLYLGGFHKAKGIELLIKTLPYVDKNIKIIIAGYIKNKKTIFTKFSRSQRYFNLLVNSNKISIMGYVKDVPNLLANIDILIFPATKTHFARPIIEAGAMSKPVIATNVEGINEIVKENVTGLLVEPNNPVALAEAINTLAKNPEMIKHFGENGYNFVRQIFDVKLNTSKIVAIYESITKI